MVLVLCELWQIDTFISKIPTASARALRSHPQEVCEHDQLYKFSEYWIQQHSVGRNNNVVIRNLSLYLNQHFIWQYVHQSVAKREYITIMALENALHYLQCVWHYMDKGYMTLCCVLCSLQD